MLVSGPVARPAVVRSVEKSAVESAAAVRTLEEKAPLVDGASVASGPEVNTGIRGVSASVAARYEGDGVLPSYPCGDCTPIKYPCDDCVYVCDGDCLPAARYGMAVYGTADCGVDDKCRWSEAGRCTAPPAVSASSRSSKVRFLGLALGLVGDEVLR